MAVKRVEPLVALESMRQATDGSKSMDGDLEPRRMYFLLLPQHCKSLPLMGQLAFFQLKESLFLGESFDAFFGMEDDEVVGVFIVSVMSLMGRGECWLEI